MLGLISVLRRVLKVLGNVWLFEKKNNNKKQKTKQRQTKQKGKSKVLGYIVRKNKKRVAQNNKKTSRIKAL